MSKAAGEAVEVPAYETAALNGDRSPHRFRWRGTQYEVAEILSNERELETCAEGDDRYVRRHVVWVETTTGERMALSGSRGTRARAPRWTIRMMETAD